MVTAYEDAFTYLEEVLDFKPSSNPRRFSEVLAVMDKYIKSGDAWWVKFRNDPVRLAARQITEPVLLIPIYTFTQGLTEVLGRVPRAEEVSFKNKALVTEFSTKLKLYNRNHR
jgi:hypothetical protein